MLTLMQKAEQLEAEGIFIGGRRKHFETAGRKLLITLLNEGLLPGSSVLDIGCGCLRGGYWLIHFLDAGGYCGIEPNTRMLDAGLRIVLEPGLAETKRPQFDHNADFNLAVFRRKFDFYVARSIWTHTSKAQIETMLDGFVATAKPGATFLASYKAPTLFRRDYKGDAWVGISHESSDAGAVRHSLSWIQRACARRELEASELKGRAVNFGSQTWIRIRHR
jgi:SAM-dependent methyltransferase